MRSAIVIRTKMDGIKEFCKQDAALTRTWEKTRVEAQHNLAIRWIPKLLHLKPPCFSHSFRRKSKYGAGLMYWVEVAIKGNERPDCSTIFKLISWAAPATAFLSQFKCLCGSCSDPIGISDAISSRRSWTGRKRRRTRMTSRHWAHPWPIRPRLCATCLDVRHMFSTGSDWNRKLLLFSFLSEHSNLYLRKHHTVSTSYFV